MAHAAPPRFATDRLDATQILEATRRTSVPPPADARPPRPDHASPSLPATVGGHPIVAELGRGAMGVVYLAYEPALDRHVALKTLEPGALGSERGPTALEDLLKEAQTAGRLFHKGIVPIHRIGFDEEHGAFYTMRHVDGRTFEEILDSLRAEEASAVEHFPRRRLTRLFAEICRAVAHAHEQGVLHRDLKPANLIVTAQGEALVIDWGLACRVDAVEGAGHGGTLGYLAPECLRGDTSLGPASDVYSLGAILHEILTLRLPVEGDSAREVVDRTLRGELTEIERADVWAPLLPLLERCLTLDPRARFENASRLADALEDVLDGRTALSSIAGIGSGAGDEEIDGFVVDGTFERREDAWVLDADAALTTTDAVRGDWRLALDAVTPADLCAWSLDVTVHPDSATDEPHAELRLRRDERVTLSLVRRGLLVGRCLDVGLVPARAFRLEVSSEGGRVMASLDGRKLIDAQEPFPSSRSHVVLRARREPFGIRRVRLEARGAPLYLSFLSLPDQLVQEQRYREARELYLEFHRAHHERTEGQSALFKAALCATELGDYADAVRMFCELETGPLDHACAVGLARIGLADGNVEWGNTALADAYLRHHDRRRRRELWFSLLTLLESAPGTEIDGLVERGCLLLQDLRPDRDDAEQMTLLLLERARAEGGTPGMRKVAMRLIECFADQAGVVEQALISLHYAGVDEIALSLVDNTLPRAVRACRNPERRVRLLLMGTEAALTHGDFERAHRMLSEARAEVDVGHPDHPWTLGWTSLAHWLGDDPDSVLALADEVARTSATAQTSHCGILQALAHASRGDHASARRRLERVASTDHLWGQTAQAMLDDVSIDEAGFFGHHYPRRLITEAMFYVAEYQR